MKREKPQKASNPSRKPVTGTDGEPLKSAITIVKTAPKNHINDSAAATLSMAVTIFSDIRFLSCARYLTAINKQCPLSTQLQKLSETVEDPSPDRLLPLFLAQNRRSS